ncbi:alpha-L-fucosidase, partial [Bacteroides ovatus]
MNRIWFILVASLLLLSCNKQTPEKEVLPRTQKERVRWFEEARLGIMIHWSLCTPAAGRFYGEKVRNSEYAEWIRCHNKVQKADWDK